MTHIHEMAGGSKLEIRRRPHPTLLILEGRELRPDRTPHNDQWYPIGDTLMLYLQQSGSDIVDLLVNPGERNYWTEREAAGDVNARNCIHGVPINVFCGRCES